MKFVINKYITLKLENNNTVIYVNGEKCNLCCGLLVNIPEDHPRFAIESQESVDFIIDSNQYKSTWYDEIRKQVSPEEEFWAYCSNLQVWVENNYNTDLLDYNVSFPLLVRLIQAGDPLAEDVFKQEILRRIKYGTCWATSFIKSEGYLKQADLKEEQMIEGILNSAEAEALLKISNKTALKYILVTNFDDDQIRERPLNRCLLSSELFFTVDKGHLLELEIELTEEHPEIPKELITFKHLKILHIWVTDSNITIPKPSFKIKSVTWVKLIMHESVRFPNNLKLFFPELETYGIYIGLYSVK